MNNGPSFGSHQGPCRFIDLFAGLGGFHLAAVGEHCECVFASEIDDELSRVYESNFGMKPAGDIRKVSLRNVPAHDLLCAGFPCQPFSKAGKQLGRRDRERGTVIDPVIRILQRRKPNYLILENVAHFVNHGDGNTYSRLSAELEALGYETQTHQLSPHRFGVPQIRERMYLVGSRNGLNAFKWPKPSTTGSELSVAGILDKRPDDAVPISPNVEACLNAWQGFLKRYPKAAKLPSFPIWSMEFGANYTFDHDSLYELPLRALRRMRGVYGIPLQGQTKRELLEYAPSYARAESGAFPEWKQDFIRKNRELYDSGRTWVEPWTREVIDFPPSFQKLEWNCGDEERDIWNYLIQLRASGVRVKRRTTSPSLVAMTTTQVPIIAWEKRHMTVRECARLQCMDSLEHFPPYTAAMKALGNAVNVQVARLVIRSLLNSARN